MDEKIQNDSVNFRVNIRRESILNRSFSNVQWDKVLTLCKQYSGLENNLERKNSETHRQQLNTVPDKPSWQSSNEGVHERVNFDDTLWGFELAGGAYYNTPLRVTKVKPNSRAMFAGITVGDMLQTINGVNTFELTVKEAHDMILDSGIEIKLSFYAPDVLETMYSVYQDEIRDDKSQPVQIQYFEEPVPDLSYKGFRVNKECYIVWPCNKKRDILYKESNCFMVPSAYERKHAERLLKNRPEENK